MSDIVTFLSEALVEDSRIITTELILRSGDPYFDNADRQSQFEREFDTQRAGRELYAKRALLTEHGRDSDGSCIGCHFGSDEERFVSDVNDCPVLRALARVYRHRPGYDKAWGPSVAQFRQQALALMARMRERTRGTPEGEVDAVIDELRGKRDG
ncbi:MAG TPA: DUF6221 family protein [Pseudonocardiaceae bacterium]|nr:DUF6221 family protein [Pseudonocardiaceae bacterium]